MPNLGYCHNLRVASCLPRALLLWLYWQVAWQQRKPPDYIWQIYGIPLFFFVAEVAIKEYAESNLMLDISTSETVLDTGTGLASAGARGSCCRVGKQRDYLNAFREVTSEVLHSAGEQPHTCCVFGKPWW